MDLTLQNYAWTYNGQNIIELLINSVVVSSGTVVLSLMAGVPAAYYFARIHTPSTKRLFIFVLSTRMAPAIALSLPMFVLFALLGLGGSYVAVVTTETIFNIAFVVWFLESAFAGTPPEIEMAAQVDGRSRLGALVDVLLPVNMPAIGASAAFVFLFSWNEYFISSLLTNSLTRPVTPALPGFIAQATSQWGQFCAVAFIASIPPMVLVLIARRFLTRAFTIGLVADEERAR